MINHVICYHNDMDGFAAACVIAKFLVEEMGVVLGYKTTRFCCVQYGKDIPKEVWDARELWIVDFSWKTPEMKRILDTVPNVHWSDHHQTSWETYEELNRDSTYDKRHEMVHDQDNAGCVLAWKQVFEGEPPSVLSYVEDRDLWKFELRSSKEINEALDLLWRPRFYRPYDNWEEFMAQDPWKHLKLSLEEIGQRCMENLERKLYGARKGSQVIQWEGFNVAVANSTEKISEIGQAICEAPGVDIGMVFFYLGKKGWAHSLRSGPYGPDVSKIAEKYGGGGHKHAAGFTTDKPLI